MAFANRADLRTFIARRLNRSDVVDADIDDAISLAESLLCIELVVIPEYEIVTTLTATAGVLTLPTDVSQIRQITIALSSSNTITLEQKSISTILEERGLSSNTTASYSRVGNSIYLNNSGETGDLTLIYYKAVPPLTDSTTNWILENSPQFYFSYALSSLFDFVYDNEKAEYWEQKYLKELERLKDAAEYTAFGGGNLVINQVQTEIQ